MTGDAGGRGRTSYDDDEDMTEWSGRVSLSLSRLIR